jgi:hypothetical protein
LFVFAAIEETGVGRVADAATAATEANAGGSGVISSDRSLQGRRAEVGAFEQGATVHAGLKSA